MPEPIMPEPIMSDAHPGRQALEHFDRVLERKPQTDDHELSALTRCLGRFRGALIALNARAPAGHGSRECLMHLNAILSVAMGMHFPIGQPPWDEFGKARHWLSELVARVEGSTVA